MKRLKKNPFIYDYGYHFTRDIDLPYILDNGFRIKEDSNPLTPERIIYGYLKPIYFVTSPNYFNLYPKSVITSYLNSRDFILKVDIKKFEQQIDFNALLDWGDYDWETEPLVTTMDKYLIIRYDSLDNNDYLKKLKLLDKYPLIKKWFIKFNYRIPLKEFKTNKQLILDTIITTQTFTILEDISPKLIVDVLKINK